jgi:hypothetical protein
MLCAYLTGRRWRWLTSHPTPDSDELLLVEREGAVPGDPDGELIAVTGGIQPADIGGQARAWLDCRLRRIPDDRSVDVDRPPTSTREQIAWEPGDRHVDPSDARAAVAAAVDGATGGFCLFGNPAAHQS